MQRVVGVKPDDHLVCLLKFEEKARDDDGCESANAFCVSRWLQYVTTTGENLNTYGAVNAVIRL